MPQRGEKEGPNIEEDKVSEPFDKHKLLNQIGSIDLD